jgi:hypothetical protein
MLWWGIKHCWERDFLKYGMWVKEISKQGFYLLKKVFWYWKLGKISPKTAKIVEFILEKQNIPKIP